MNLFRKRKTNELFGLYKESLSSQMQVKTSAPHKIQLVPGQNYKPGEGNFTQRIDLLNQDPYFDKLTPENADVLVLYLLHLFDADINNKEQLKDINWLLRALEDQALLCASDDSSLYRSDSDNTQDSRLTVNSAGSGYVSAP